MNCVQYNLFNTGSTIASFSYQDCNAFWNYNVEIESNQSKNIWLLDGTFLISNFFRDSVNVEQSSTYLAGFCDSCDQQYTWTQYDSTSCFAQIFTSATTSPSFYQALSAPYNQYSRYGSIFYEPGFALCGTGSTYMTATTATVWANPTQSTNLGPLNRTGKWPSTSFAFAPPFNTWIGFSACLTGTTSGKTYYVGIAGDNAFRLSLDGTIILDTTANPKPWFQPGAASQNTFAFIFWHIYPVVIGNGNHILEIEALNREDKGVLGCEIYDNTLQELTGATLVSDLDIVYSTSGKTQFEIGATPTGGNITSGYTCPQGFQYSICRGDCVQTIFCNTNLTPTPTPSNTPTNTITPTPTTSIGFTPTVTSSPTSTPTNTPTNTQTPTNTSSVGFTPTNTSTPTVTPTNIECYNSIIIQVTNPVNSITGLTCCGDEVVYSGFSVGSNIINDCWSDYVDTIGISSILFSGSCTCVTSTPTPTPTATPTSTPGVTTTATPTSTPGVTTTETPTETPTSTPGVTTTETPTETPTSTPGVTTTETPTETPTSTPGVTLTETPTETPTSTPGVTTTETPTATPTSTPGVTTTETPTETPTPTPTITPTCAFGNCYHYVEFTLSGNSVIEWGLCSGSTILFYTSETYPFTFVEGPTIESDCFSANTYTVISGSTPYALNYFNPCCEEAITPTPTPTQTNTPSTTTAVTPTVTNTETPTNTPTPTSTDLSSLTTYTISGCSSSNVLVANLLSPNLAPNDVFYLDFTGATTTECYKIINKVNDTPTDGSSPVTFYASCAECLDQTTTVYSISGCTNMVTLNADLLSPNLFPGDVLYIEFTGSTLDGCYTVIEKMFNTVPTDTVLTNTTYSSCGLCEAAIVTPTPTVTETPTPTPSPTSTTTQTVTPTQTSTDTPTPTPTQTPTQSETPTQTPTQTSTDTPTPTPTQSETSTQTPTQTPTNTPTNTETPSATPPPTCYVYQNNSGESAYYDWTACDGTEYLNNEILDGATICARSADYISGGVLTGPGSICT